MGERAFSIAPPALNLNPSRDEKNRNLHSHFGKIEDLIFRPSISILNPLCPGMLDRRIGTVNGQ